MLHQGKIGEFMNAEQKKQFSGVLKALERIDVKDLKQGDKQRIHFDSSSWDRYLSAAGRMNLATALNALPEAMRKGLITRHDLTTLANTATTQHQRKNLLIATLVWGKGPRNNRMFPAFVRLLTDERLDAALSSSAAHAGAGRPAAAYRAWRESRVGGLGEAFFTKWLWAATHIGKNRFTTENPRCLVLDTRVWNTLGDGAHPWSSVIAAGTRQRPERYESYTRACALWAQELGVRAEDIEWALFTANGRLEKRKFAKG
jgi:hypothetical protein